MKAHANSMRGDDGQHFTLGRAVVVTVSATSFTPYTVSMGGTPWLTDGSVAITCGGARYSADDNSLQPVQSPVSWSGSDHAGAFIAIEQQWQAGTCAPLNTSVRYYPGTDAFEFVTTLPDGATGTSTSPIALRRGYRGRGMACNASTEFPTWRTPRARAPPGLGMATWDGAMLFGPARLERPLGSAASANLSGWEGGLVNGPLVFYANASSSERPPALVLGPSAAFKVGVLIQSTRPLRNATRAADRWIIGGAHGLIASLPRHFELRFGLAGSTDGVTAAALAWGDHLQRAHSAAATRLTLSDDALSRELHYLTDGGAAENYCDYWLAGCANSSSTPCRPMHAVLSQLRREHAALGLGVGTYHLDPFWWSHEPFGGCELGAAAQVLAPSPFHFPSGTTGGLGLPGLQLIVKFFTQPNAYSKSYAFDGLGVGGADSGAFWGYALAQLRTSASLRSLVWDGVDFTWFSSDKRLQSTDEQARADAGLAGAALAAGLPIRVDTATPSDVLASVQRGAVTTQRVTADADPHDYFEESW